MTPGVECCDGKGKGCDMGLYEVEIGHFGDVFGGFQGFGVEEEGFFETGPEVPVFG